MNLIIVLAIIIVVPVVYFIFTYNGLITLRNRVKEGMSDIDVQLKRRYDLIPNLVETVKGYAKHEDSVLMKVTEARTKAMNAGGTKEQLGAQNMITDALKSVFAVAENYPDLKANQNFIQLQNELVDTEDKIQAARRFYNGMVRDLNTKIESFPSNLIANLFHFAVADFFELDNPAAKEPVAVNFSAPAAEAPKAEEKK